MRSRIFYLLLLGLTFCNFCFSQEFVWSKKKYNPQNLASTNIITDKDGNVYEYGSRFFPAVQWYYHPFDSQSDTSGTFFNKYSPNGVLLTSKKWNFPFFIGKIIYDGNANFYFCGTFAGTHVIDGISIASQGGSVDAMVGKMNLNGTMAWIKTLGGPKNTDELRDIRFDYGTSKLIVSGTIADTLYINNVLKTVSTQSILLAKFDFSGTNLSNKLIDFCSQKNTPASPENQGMEVCLDNRGGYYLLANREGHAEYRDSIVDARQGMYIFRLNQNLDTLWSYYNGDPSGYGGGGSLGKNINAALNGDLYFIENHFSYRVGTVIIIKIDGSTGQELWRKENYAGSYSNLFIDGETLYVTGIEGVVYCMCPADYGGYSVVEKLASDGSVLGLTKINGVYFENFAKDNLGNLFVTGEFFQKRSALIASDTIIADSTTYSNSSTSYYCRFLSKLNDKNCSPLEITSSAHSYYSAFSFISCPGASVILYAPSQFTDYHWSNGSTAQSINTNSPGWYSVNAKNSSGCTSYSIPVSLSPTENNQKPGICYSGVDTALNKKVLNFGEYIYSPPNFYFKIFKEDKDGVLQYYDTISFQNYYGNKKYTDPSSDASEGARKYAITLMDTCGIESPMSDFFEPIYLTVTRNNNANLLDWNHYLGRRIDKYDVFRGASPSNMALITSVDTSAHSYADVIPDPSQVYFYMIQSRLPWSCSAGDNASLSNIVRDDQVLAATEQAKGKEIEISPNPFNDRLEIKLPETGAYEIKITNALGMLVKKSTRTQNFASIDCSDLKAGVYFATIKSEKGEKNFTVIKQ